MFDYQSINPTDLDTEDRVLIFKDTMRDIVSDNTINELLDLGFFQAPASLKYHGSYQGGLFDHSFIVAKNLLQMTNHLRLEWELERSPLLIGMFHDLCKVDSYKPSTILVDSKQTKHPISLPDPTRWEYNTDQLFLGHGDKSVMLLSQFFKLTLEEICCIRYHMGAFTEKEEWNDYTNAIKTYPNVLWTHTADMIASHMVGV